MIQIRPVSDLRNKFSEIEKAVGGGEPVYLTKNGYGTMVVLSLDAYSRLTGGVEVALDDVARAILERLPNADSFEPYHSAKERRYKYYRIYVKNYIVYYVVIDDEGPDKIMEVRRFLYNKHQFTTL